MGKAVKIIDIDETGNHLQLREEVLHSIFSKVPDDMPVSIVGVVGAFRTGKSFLLDFFLRYLKSSEGKKLDTNFDIEDEKLSWMFTGDKLEGGSYSDGFKWKAGAERCTTGIWMWNEFFTRKDPETLKNTAVFLMDTQGMYDSDTSQHVTATIYGLGSLISSYMVFNLKMQIQEDNLQNLALFSEYGRVALKEASKAGKTNIRPFQKMEFLIRDFPHFKTKKDDNLEKYHQEMANYLESVLQKRGYKDSSEAREQLEACYEDISCFCLPYPGEKVAEADEEFEGEVEEIKEKFTRLLGDYVRRVFNERIEIKKIQGKEICAMELFEFIKIYTRLFKESEIFPEAKTLFRAIQEANIAFAQSQALQVYKEEMDVISGIGASFKKDEELLKAHRKAVKAALKSFAEHTKLGNDIINEDAEVELRKKIEERFSEYKESNRLRDPFSFIAPYIIPILIAVGAYIMRYILESICPRRSFVCLDFADFFTTLYTVIFSFLLFHMVSTGYGLTNHIGTMFALNAKMKQE